MKIIIDIGHARGTGASAGGLSEHSICEVIGSLLRGKLIKLGHEVSLLDFPDKTNREDINLTITAANSIKDAGVGISLHCDSSGNAEARGAHVIYTSARGREVARFVAAHIAGLLPGRASSSIRRDNLAMLNATRAPWIIAECGFISSKNDRSMYQPEGLERIAAALAAGLNQYAQSRHD